MGMQIKPSASRPAPSKQQPKEETTLVYTTGSRSVGLALSECSYGRRKLVAAPSVPPSVTPDRHTDVRTTASSSQDRGSGRAGNAAASTANRGLCAEPDTIVADPLGLEIDRIFNFRLRLENPLVEGRQGIAAAFLA